MACMWDVGSSLLWLSARLRSSAWAPWARPPPASPRRTLAAADQLEGGVLAELNAIRRAHGLVPVRLSPPLSAAADAHSRSMGRFGYFEHESRDGSAFWKRVQRFYGAES